MLAFDVWEYELRHFYAEDMNGGDRAAPNESATLVDTDAYLPSSLDTSGGDRRELGAPFRYVGRFHRRALAGR
jgi:hypothetical protein